MVVVTILHRLVAIQAARAPDSGRILWSRPLDTDLRSPWLLLVSPILMSWLCVPTDYVKMIQFEING